MSPAAQGLTWDVPVSVLQSVEIVHELPHWNLERLKESRINKQPVRHLNQKKKKKKLKFPQSHLKLNKRIQTIMLWVLKWTLDFNIHK